IAIRDVGSTGDVRFSLNFVTGPKKHGRKKDGGHKLYIVRVSEQELEMLGRLDREMRREVVARLVEIRRRDKGEAKRVARLLRTEPVKPEKNQQTLSELIERAGQSSKPKKLRDFFGSGHNN